MKGRRSISLISCALITSASAFVLDGDWLEGKNDWLFPVDEIRFYTSERVEASADALEAITVVNRLFSIKRIDTYMSLIPIRARIYQSQLPIDVTLPKIVIDRYKNALSYLNSRNVRTIDLNTIFLAKSDTANQYPLYLRRDHHWSAEGGILAAQAVAKVITNSRKLISDDIVNSEIIRGQPTLSTKPVIIVKGQSTQTRQTESYIPIFVKNTTEQSLLDNEYFPITVVGDSFSNGERDGVGFFAYASLIEHYTQRRVYNAAEPGKGTFTPMLNYLNSIEYLNTPPKVINWEAWEAALLGQGQAAMPEGFLKQAGLLILGNCLKPRVVKTGEIISLSPNDYIIAKGLSEETSKMTFSTNGQASLTSVALNKSGDGNAYIFPEKFSPSVILRLQNRDNSLTSEANLEICEAPPFYFDSLSMNGKIIDYAERNYKNQLETQNFNESLDFQSYRWALNSESSIRFLSSKESSGYLNLVGENIFEGEVIKISLNGKNIGEIVPKDGKFKFFSPIKATVGLNTLKFQFSKYRDSDNETKKIVNDPRPLAVKFTSLKIGLN